MQIDWLKVEIGSWESTPEQDAPVWEWLSRALIWNSEKDEIRELRASLGAAVRKLVPVPTGDQECPSFMVEGAIKCPGEANAGATVTLFDAKTGTFPAMLRNLCWGLVVAPASVAGCFPHPVVQHAAQEAVPPILLWGAPAQVKQDRLYFQENFQDLKLMTVQNFIQPGAGLQAAGSDWQWMERHLLLVGARDHLRTKVCLLGCRELF